MAVKRSWKKLLIEARELAAQGRKNLYNIVSLAVAIFDDKDFRAEAEVLDDFDAAAHLDAELFSDWGFEFLQLRAVYKQFPDAKAWQERKISELYAELESGAPEAEKTQRSTTRIKKADYEAAIAERDDALHRNKILEERLTDVESENRQLKLEIANLKGQISRLETMQKRDAA